MVSEEKTYGFENENLWLSNEKPMVSDIKNHTFTDEKPNVNVNENANANENGNVTVNAFPYSLNTSTNNSDVHSQVMAFARKINYWEASDESYLYLTTYI